MRRIVLLALAFLMLSTPVRSAEPPLFDGHIHYSRPDWTAYTPDQVFAILDQAGIRRALVSSTRDDMSTWWKDPAIIAYLEQRLAKGVHRGIGEFHIHGKDIRTPELARITEMAVQRNLYLHAHSDAAAVIELFAIEPRSKIIWAHAGMSSGPQAVGV